MFYFALKKYLGGRRKGLSIQGIDSCFHEIFNGNRQTARYFAFWPSKVRITEEGFSWLLVVYDRCRKSNFRT
jgi:hypothetical protein